jgi:hypothetical protein
MGVSVNAARRLLAVLSGVALLSGCAFPTHDRAKLAAMRHEADMLMKAHKTGQMKVIPESEWPPAIAIMRPETVWVDQAGVEILMKAYFDGGWGYYIPQGHRQLSANQFKNLGAGVYWHGPH